VVHPTSYPMGTGGSYLQPHPLSFN
jgi:hypothetical protein